MSLLSNTFEHLFIYLLAFRCEIGWNGAKVLGSHLKYTCSFVGHTFNLGLYLKTLTQLYSDFTPDSTQAEE